MTKVTRSRDDRVVAGVCGGLAEAYDVDVNVLRAAFALPLLWGLYLVMWAVLPLEEEAES